MSGFRHLALIFLFLSPVAAADEAPLDGSALLGRWWREVRHLFDAVILALFP